MYTCRAKIAPCRCVLPCPWWVFQRPSPRCAQVQLHPQVHGSYSGPPWANWSPMAPRAGAPQGKSFAFHTEIE